MSIFLTKAAQAATPASVFAAHYDFLMDWALRFAQNNHAAAEDLVQETFIKFVTTQIEVEDPGNARPLLYTYLKNVYGAELRKSQRHPIQTMTTIEFDSLQMSLRERAGADPIEVQDELRNIMSYLCWRKESLKPASILLLRFFYSYSPDEITKIGLMSRQSIDHGLSTAREEVRAHIRSAGRLSLLRAGGPPPAASKQIALPADHFLEELEAALARTRSTSCLSRESLLDHYTARPRKALSCTLLAHLVSCHSCLEIVHKFYEFPEMTDKGSKALLEMTRPGGSGRGNKKDVSAAKSKMGRLLDIAGKRSRELHEHRPKSLMLIVNGETIASQDVCSSTNTQRVEWKPDRPLDFIEIESEQGVGMLVMPVRVLPPDSPPEMRREVALSNGRSLTVTLSFTGPAYTIEVTYNDPLFFATATPEARELYEAELFGESTAVEENHGDLNRDSAAGESVASPSLSKSWRDLFRWIKMPDFNPIFATAVVLAAASVMCFFIWNKWRPLPISANELLVKAETWDGSSQPNAQPGVVRQSVSISTSQGSFERTIYRDTQGVRRPKQAKNSVQTESLKSRLASVGVDWERPLSAISYQDWHDHQHVRHDHIERVRSKLLTLTTTTPDGPVARESITVREADFHPIERTIEFRDSGTVQIAEVNYEVLPWSQANPDWFEPLTPTATGTKAIYPSATRIIPPSLDDSQLDLAELETRVALSHLDAEINGRLELVRSVQGIEVKGIVATSDRRQQLERDLSKIPHVRFDIHTFDEMETSPPGETQITKIATESAVAAASPLQIYLMAKGWSRDDMGRLAQDLFNRSAAIERESRALEELAARFPEPNNLEGRGRAAFDTLVIQHRSVLREELESEHILLAKIGASEVSDSDTLAPVHRRDLDGLAKTNRALCNELLTGTTNQLKSADVILSGIATSLSQIREEVAHNEVAPQDGAVDSQAGSSASLPNSHGKP